ncbi:hypothetical protein [Pyrobaculum sp.]|uniref:hypothetical protein n=1 Tax=Pyrobaculum sp. TaxID=2004705 RepID=UPI003D140C8E
MKTLPLFVLAVILFIVGASSAAVSKTCPYVNATTTTTVSGVATTTTTRIPSPGCVLAQQAVPTLLTVAAIALTMIGIISTLKEYYA